MSVEGSTVSIALRTTMMANKNRVVFAHSVEEYATALAAPETI